MSARTFGQATILVIDENASVRAGVRSTLEAAGFRVMEQPRTAGAVAAILQHKPELVLLDLNLTKSGGDIVPKLFGKGQAKSETLVLLHGALPADTAEGWVLSTGAHGYVQRSEEAYDLLRQINRWLDVSVRTSHSRLRAVRTPPHAGAEALESSFPTRSRSGAHTLALPLTLFIDDDMGTLSAFRREVQTEPYVSEFLLSGERALQRIVSDAPPDVVVCDFEMRQPAGVEIYRRAVDVDPTFTSRFVFVTQAAVAADREGLLASFTGVFLHVPVSGSELRSAIRRALAPRETARQRSS